MPDKNSADTIQLPQPYDGKQTFEKVLQSRRSVREYSDQPVALKEVSQMLWAAQGVTHPRGLRNAPSAGALYPLEIYVMSANVSDLAVGLYHYNPAKHVLQQVGEGDFQKTLHKAALSQEPIADAPVVFVITAEFQRTERKYGKRATRYVHIEVGHAAQNLLLQATSLGLAGVPVGAFRDSSVTRALDLPAKHEPLYLLAIGHLAK